MSISASGQDIACDASGCKNTARLAAGLRPSANRAASVEGWFFLNLDGIWQHYCPDCGRAYLNSDKDPLRTVAIEANEVGIPTK